MPYNSHPFTPIRFLPFYCSSSGIYIIGLLSPISRVTIYRFCLMHIAPAVCIAAEREDYITPCIIGPTSPSGSRLAPR